MAGRPPRHSCARQRGIAVDGDSNIYVADESYHRIRKIDGATGIIQTLAGNGDYYGPLGDGGLASEASLQLPKAVAVGAAGELYIASDHRIRLVRPGATLSVPLGASGETVVLLVAEDGTLRFEGRLVARGRPVVWGGRRYELTAGTDGGLMATHLPWGPGPEVALLDAEWLAGASSDTVSELLDGLGKPVIMSADAKTPVHLAAQVNPDPGVTRALLDRVLGSSATSRDASGRTPLHYAALGSDSLAVTELLLDRGAYPHLVDNDLKTALDLATESGNEAVAELLARRAGRLALPDPHLVPTWRLLWGDWARVATLASVTAILDADPNALSSEVRSRGGLLERVVRLNPDPSVTQLILDRVPEVSFATLLPMAGYNPNPEVARVLLDRGAQADGGVLSRAARNRNPAVIDLLLDRGADAGTEGVLHTAAANWNPAVAELLLDRGAEVNGTDRFGATALHHAARNPNAAVARLLLNRGADVNAGLDPPLSGIIGLGSSDWVNPGAGQQLIDAGAFGAPSPTGLGGGSYWRNWLSEGSPTQVRQLLDELGDDAVPIVNTWDGSALHTAALNRNPAVAALLLDRGASVQEVGNGLTPLHEAARFNGNPAVADLLVRRGADLAGQNDADTTPLLLAWLNNRSGVAATLIANGAQQQVWPAENRLLDVDWLEREHGAARSPDSTRVRRGLRAKGLDVRSDAGAPAGLFHRPHWLLLRPPLVDRQPLQTRMARFQRACPGHNAPTA